MGNNQSNTSLKRGNIREISDVKSAEDTRLCQSFQKYASAADDLSCLTEDTFQNQLYPDFAALGSSVFSTLLTLSGESRDSPTLTREQYVSTGKEVLGLVTGTQQTEFYFKVFSEDSNQLSKTGCLRLLQACYLVTWLSAGVVLDLQSEDSLLTGVIESLYGCEEYVCQSDFTQWVSRHCPRLLTDLHTATVTALCGHPLGQQTGASCSSSLVEELSHDQHVISLQSVWMLANTLPTYYIPETTTSPESSLNNSCRLSNIANLVSNEGWQLLYSSNHQGLSFNRFHHHVFSYSASTVTLLTFEGHCYCLAVDEEWRQSGQRWGGLDSCLIQIRPQYKLIQAGEKLVYLNIQDRSMPKALQVGKDPRKLILKIDEGFSKVSHYGVEFNLSSIEVWGCGGPSARKAQQKQKQWEKTDAEKHKERKLKLEDWKDNPDRELLNLGGVKTEHAER